MLTADPARRWLPRVHEVARRGHYWTRDYVYAAGRLSRTPLDRRIAARYTTGALAPVVILPGVVEPWTMLLPVVAALHAAGHPVHVIPELSLNLATFADSAALVTRTIQDRRLSGVILVAHSKGGLIGKRILLDDTDGRIDRLIAIATPFHGSGLARFVPSRPIRALRPNEPTILDMAANAHVNARITSIYPGFDPHIPESSRLDGATNVEVRAMGHFRVLKDPDVLAAVLAAVR